MRTLLFTAPLLIILGTAYACSGDTPQAVEGCVRLVNQKYEFINDETQKRTIGIKSWGIIQNQCPSEARFINLDIIICTGGLPSHVLKHLTSIFLKPGEMQEFYYEDQIRNSPEGVILQLRWNQ